MRGTDTFDGAFAITPHDTNILAATPSAIYVGTTGDVTLDTAGGDVDVTFASVPAGEVLRVRAIRVKSTGTTASDLVGLY